MSAKFQAEATGHMSELTSEEAAVYADALAERPLRLMTGAFEAEDQVRTRVVDAAHRLEWWLRCEGKRGGE